MLDLPSEIEILNRIQGDWTQPLVTFLCTTYNQEDYIEQTMRGFLKQKTSFPYEILIHDDKSTDGTVEILEKYRSEYPNVIRCIYQDENKYSQGLSVILIGAQECRSDYIALCEGDDYWIDENKIENQFNLMISDKSIAMVVSPGKLERNGKILPELHCYYGPNTKIVKAQDILDVPDQFAPTASYMIKKYHLVNALETFVDTPVDDLFIELYSAIYGKLIYYPEVSSVYRTMAKNSFSERMSSGELINKVKFVDSINNAISLSRGIKDFENLDWSLKLSYMYYGLSVICFKNKDFYSCGDAIEKSMSFKVINNKQKIIFNFKEHTFLLYLLASPILFFKNTYKSYFKQ